MGAEARSEDARAAGLEDVSSDLQLKNPQVKVDDRPRQDRGRSASPSNQVETALYNAYGTRQVSQIYAPEQPVPGDPAGGARSSSRTRARCRLLYVRSSERHALVPLDTVAKVAPTPGPLAVSHTGQLPSVTISFNLKPGVALGDAVDAVQSVAADDAAVDDRDDVPGHRAGVSGLAAGPRPDPRDGDRRHLHRAGRSLRELHPPADDSLRACRRPASARCSRC